MKKILPLIILLIASTTASAQLFKKKEKTVEPQYQAGVVTTDASGRVVFEETIEAPGLSAEDIKQKVNGWMDSRFVEPKIISKKNYDSENPNAIETKIEEYIVFTKKFLVLNRARIYYFLTIGCEDGKCNFKMSRITYWHDDENPDGGLRLKAEECITDEQAFDSENRLKKFNGRFRRKTIDLKNSLIEELSQILSAE